MKVQRPEYHFPDEVQARKRKRDLSAKTNAELSHDRQMAEKSTYSATKRAQKQIDFLHKRINEENRLADEVTDKIKTEQDIVLEKAKLDHEHDFIVEKERSAERLSSLKQKNQSEYNRLRRSGERQLLESQDKFQRNLHSQNSYQDRELQKSQAEAQLQLEHIKNRDARIIEELEATNLAQIQDLTSTNEHLYEKAHQQKSALYERLKNRTAEEMDKSAKIFEDRYKAISENQRRSLARQQLRANRELAKLREEHSQKLAIYDSRGEDPFYKMVKLGGELQETDTHFVWQAQVPAHEQKDISVSIKGGDLVIEGQRRNEERVEVEPGHFISTHSFQKYSEAIALPQPVNKEHLYREFQGDTLMISIPKWRNRHEIATEDKDYVPIEARRPQFPGDLPKQGDAAFHAELRAKYPDASDEEINELAKVSRSSRGGESLS